MPSSLIIEIADEQAALDVPHEAVRAAVVAVLGDAGVTGGMVSLALLDDPTLRELNREFLSHDWDTDVLSFVLDRGDQWIEGEVLVSTDTAIRQAGVYGWDAQAELMLYVIHGALHLVGYDDKEPSARAAMRRREEEYLRRMGHDIYPRDE